MARYQTNTHMGRNGGRRPDPNASSGARINASYPTGRRHHHHHHRYGSGTGSGVRARALPLRGRDGLPPRSLLSRMTGGEAQAGSTASESHDQQTESRIKIEEGTTGSIRASNSTVNQSGTNRSNRPIRMINVPVGAPKPEVKPKITGRPGNTYRGKNVVKRLVQNKKLQAILMNKNPLRERKWPMGERLVLRQAMTKKMT